MSPPPVSVSSVPLCFKIKQEETMNTNDLTSAVIGGAFHFCWQLFDFERGEKVGPADPV